MGRIKILIADDNFVARRGLRSFLETDSEIAVAGEVSTGRAAIDWSAGNTADVILMDVRMPDTDGIEATMEILKLKPGAKILMLTVIDEQATLLRALMAGAKGYLVYGRFTPEELIKAIRSINEGNIVTVPPLSGALIENIRAHLENEHELYDGNMKPLTAREKEILGYIATGRRNSEIADILHLEEKTVKNHINNIYSKLQLKSRYEAISYMFRRNP